MQLNKAFTYFYSVINKNQMAFSAIIIQGLILGIFLQNIMTNNIQNEFLYFIQLIIVVCSIIGLIVIWFAYTLIISKFYLGHLSRGVIREILKYDSISYMPLSISIVIGVIISYSTGDINYQIWAVVIGFMLIILSKIVIINIKPPNKDIYLAEKAQQVKNKHVNTISDLNPDKNYTDRIEIDSRYPIRKYIVTDELRNAINLKNSKSGSLKIKLNSSDEVRYSIGWESEEIYPDGNLKLYQIEDQKEEMIFNKDAVHILEGWNEYQIIPKVKSKTIEIRWNNSINDDIYLSFSDLSTIKPKDKKNIIVIVFDGVYRDTLGLYRGDFQADAVSNFFKDSLIFSNAYSQGEWTMPNFAIMATSLYQSHHGVYDPDLYSKKMPESHKTLAEIFQENGYNTFGYVGHNRVSPGYGHARGYNRFIYRCTYDESTENYTLWKGGRYNKDVKISDIRKRGNNNKDITFNAIKFLRDNQQTNNFLFLHYFDTHQPFFQIPDTKSSVNDALYNNNIQDTLFKKELKEEDLLFIRELYKQKYNEVNENISLLFDYITKYENDYTTVLFTTDHGTVLFDEETKSMLSPGKGGRDNYLTKSIMKVPLMIRISGKTYKGGKVIDGIIEANIAIMPTVLGIAGIKPPNNIDGVSVLKRTDDGISGKGYAIAESCYKDRYELFLNTMDFDYFLKTGRDRATNKIHTDPGIETFYDPKGNIITDKDRQKELKQEISRILENNNLSNILKK